MHLRAALPVVSFQRCFRWLACAPGGKAHQPGTSGQLVITNLLIKLLTKLQACMLQACLVRERARANCCLMCQLVFAQRECAPEPPPVV